MGQVHVALLGTPDIRHSGVALVLPTRKALALLVYMVVEGGLHARDKLADLFWPDSATAAQSRGALRYTLSYLRAALRHDGGSSHVSEGKALGFDFDAAGELDYDLHDFLARSEEHTSELQSLRHLVCR